MAACRFFVCCAVCAITGVAIADDASIPIPPKVTKIKYVSPVFFSTKDPNITVMADDKNVLQQVNKIKNVKNISNLTNAGKLLKPGQPETLSKPKNVETISFPVRQEPVKVTNSKATFLFVDTTRRSKDSHTSQLLSMSDASRKLQVEAARQAAYKVKKNSATKSVTKSIAK